MTEQTHEEEEKQKKQSPGQILVAAREALNIDLADLAKQIKVPLYVLEAIDKDRVPKNLPETFVRGYIRSYAKKVNIDADLVLPQVETVGVIFDDADNKEMQSFSRRNKRKALERRLSRVTWILAIVLIGGLIFWWLQDNQYTEFAPVAGNNDDHLVVEAHEVKAEVTVTPVATEETQTLSAVELAQVAEEVEPEAKQTPATDIQEPVKLTASQKAAVSDNGEVDEEGYIKVEMRFENDCWVEVHDMTGDRIAIGNKPAGYVMSLNAQAPLNVLLGNPEGVTILVNGKPFSLADLPKNRVARFEVEAL
jgi:cytoskeleton protein RodZ